MSSRSYILIYANETDRHTLHLQMGLQNMKSVPAPNQNRLKGCLGL